MKRFFISFKSEWMPTKSYHSFNEAKVAMNNYITVKSAPIDIKMV
jgi:putative transposase